MVKRILLIIWLTFLLFPNKVLASPIQGTFIFPDFTVSTDAQLDSFLTEIKGVGMDTIVLNYTGVVYRSPTCTSNYIMENFFDGTRSNYLENPAKILQAAKDKNFSVYVGLAGTWNCVTPSSDPDKIIAHSKTLVQNLKTLCSSKGWDCSGNGFIKGYYLPIEFTLKDFGGSAGFYKNLYAGIKTVDPVGKIIISSYTNNTYSPEDYQTAYNAGFTAVRDGYADIIALQDSVGSGKVTTFASDRDHFKGLTDGVKAANLQYGKSIEVWANIELFHNVLDSSIWPPTDIKTLSWQLRATDDLVTTKISWLYSWGLAISPLLENNGSKYTPDFATKRKQLRADYLSKPLIMAAFTWYTPTNFVVKGYNFGQNGESVNFYLHYQTANNQTKTFHTTSSLFSSGKLFELRIPLTSLSDFDTSKPYQLAVKNPAGAIGYYVSSNPESAPTPAFSEIKTGINNIREFMTNFSSVLGYNGLVASFGK